MLTEACDTFFLKRPSRDGLWLLLFSYSVYFLAWQNLQYMHATDFLAVSSSSSCVCVLCDGVPAFARQPLFLISLGLRVFNLSPSFSFHSRIECFGGYCLYSIPPLAFPSLSYFLEGYVLLSLTLTYTFISFQRKRRLDKRKDTQREKERKGKAKLTAGDGSWWNGSGNDVMDDFCDGLWGRRRRWHKRGENLHNRWRRQIRVEQKTSPLYWVPMTISLPSQQRQHIRPRK